jgi:hypothetical protein
MDSPVDCVETRLFYIWVSLGATPFRLSNEFLLGNLWFKWLQLNLWHHFHSQTTSMLSTKPLQATFIVMATQLQEEKQNTNPKPSWTETNQKTPSSTRMQASLPQHPQFLTKMV